MDVALSPKLGMGSIVSVALSLSISSFCQLKDGWPPLAAFRVQGGVRTFLPRLESGAIARLQGANP